jgi:threonine/homoserine/homoserine lactone efflux protein
VEGQAVGDILPMAVGVSLSPVPIIAIVLMPGTPRARTNGPAFAVGWVLGLTVAGGVILALASGRSEEDDGPATWVSVLKLVLGVLFVLIAARTWRGRPRRGAEAEVPRWMQTIDNFETKKSLGAGVLLSALNPKNLALTIAAAAAIAAAGVSGGEGVAALAVFVVVGSLSIVAPVVIYLTLGRPGHRDPRRPQELDGRAQRRDHDRAAARPRRQTDRRRDQRAEFLSALARFG